MTTWSANTFTSGQCVVLWSGVAGQCVVLWPPGGQTALCGGRGRVHQVCSKPGGQSAGRLAPRQMVEE